VGSPGLHGAEVGDPARDRGEVVLGRRAAHAGAPVRDLGAAPVRGAVGLAAREIEIERAVSRAQPESARRARQGARYKVGREAHDAGRAVDVRAVLLEDRQRLGRAEAHGGPLQHLEDRHFVAT